MIQDSAIREAINLIVDPCSAGRGVPIGLVDMGLLRDVRIRNDGDQVQVEVDMRVTSPGCMFVVEFNSLIKRHLEDLGVDRVVVDWDAELFDWTEDDIDAAARARMRAYRDRLDEVAPGSRIPLAIRPVA